MILAGALVLVLFVLLGLAIWPPAHWWLWRQMTRPIRKRVRPHRDDPRVSRHVRR